MNATLTKVSGLLTIAGAMTSEQLAQWRKDMGVSVAKAAEMLGVSRQTYYVYLRGEVPVPRAVELACAALVVGIRSYPPEMPSTAASAADASLSFVLAAPFTGPPGAPALAD